MRIALLGGSFDPPHLAHLQVLRHLLDRGGFDRIWIVPSPQNPLKPGSTPFEKRYEMARLAFAGLGPQVEVRDDEASLSGFTIDLIRKLRDENPVTQFTFIGGSDLREQLPRWKDSEELLRLLSFEFLPRPPAPDSHFLPISSSEIRERAKKGLPLDGFVPKAVKEYIVANGIYAP
jgi:nicotinate-nucleotide adenylyltransferase